MAQALISWVAGILLSGYPGWVATFNEPTGASWGLGVVLEHVWRDVRFSLRSLRRSMTFSAAVVATLALCIGANLAILSVLYGLILKPLPFPDAGQIVDVYNSRPKVGQL